MRNLVYFLILLATAVFLVSCVQVYQEDYATDSEAKRDYEIQTAKSVTIPEDGSGPIAGMTEAESPDAIVTFNELGERTFVENGSTVNFIYDGVDPAETYVMYESTKDGYYLTLVKKDERVNVYFKEMCQIFIVGRPDMTTIDVPENLRYEQIIWTPRSDGTWELRIGTTQRGCKSRALNQLQELRTSEYEDNVPK